MTKAYKEVGTLKEIGTQAGDVVVMVESDSGDYVGDVGIFHDGYVKCLDGSGFHHDYEDDCCGYRWRIISRAQPKTEQAGPVRTVTRTTREIVPGVYGVLSIKGGGDGFVTVEVADHLWNMKDLTAAIQTLTAIRDALKEKEE